MGKQRNFEAPCPVCGQLVLVDAPEAADEETLEALALQACNCDGAKLKRESDARIRSAQEWAEKNFSDDNTALSLVLTAINAVRQYVFDKITIKQGKHNYTIDLSKDGLIRIKSKYTEQIQREF